jgi:hypothetical protein
MSITYTQADLLDDDKWKPIRLAKNAEIQAGVANGSRPALSIEFKITWDKTHHVDGSPLSAADITATERARDVKAREMWLLDKMAVNLVYVENATTVYRYAYTPAAVDEWVEFITTQATTYSMNAPVIDHASMDDGLMSQRIIQATAARDARAVVPGDMSYSSGAEL